MLRIGTELSIVKIIGSGKPKLAKPLGRTSRRRAVFRVSELTMISGLVDWALVLETYHQ